MGLAIGRQYICVIPTNISHLSSLGMLIFVVKYSCIMWYTICKLATKDAENLENAKSMLAGTSDISITWSGLR